MEYASVALHVIATAFFLVFAIRALAGKFELTSSTWCERWMLASTLAYLALDNIKPLAESLHKIVGGN